MAALFYIGVMVAVFAVLAAISDLILLFRW
jgi:hypothetical protein